MNSFTSFMLSAMADSGTGSPISLHQVFEMLAVFRLLDGFQRRTEQFDAVFFQHALLRQPRRQVQAGLPAQRGQQAVRALFGDDLGEKFHRQRLDVDFIGHIGVGHDGGRIAVDQHHLQPFFTQRAAGLRAGIIELGRLSDHDRPGPDHHHPF